MTTSATGLSRPGHRPAGNGQGAASARATLHRRAPETARRHLIFAWGRVTALLASDLGVFLLVRAILATVQGESAFAAGIGRMIHAALPVQYFTGWQFPAAMVLGLAVAGTYGRADARRDAGGMLVGVALGSALCLWQNAWTFGLPKIVIQFVASVGVVWLPLMGGRFLIDFIVSRVWPEQHRIERVLFVGNHVDTTAQRISAKLLGSGGMVSLGWVHAAESNGHRRDPDYWETLHRAAADTVVVFGNLPSDVFDAVVEAATAAGCRILIVPRHEGVAKLRHGVVWHRGLPFIELTVPSLRAQELLMKRVIDVLGAAAGLLLLAPFFALLSIAILIDSRGPVFFSQERVGLGGRIFRFWKFRTMREGADEEKTTLSHLNHSGDPRLFKIPNDPRVTRIGVWLRRWSLDELPQLWNVLVGDMSLVGPRPFFESDLDAYRDHHFSRLGAKPGITGLWQVSGRSDVVDFEEVVRLDRMYIDRWSLWLDLKIMAMTVPAVLKRTGAY